MTNKSSFIPYYIIFMLTILYGGDIGIIIGLIVLLIVFILGVIAIINYYMDESP
jgi:hypothetical protein